MLDALVDVGHLDGEVDDAVAVLAVVVEDRAVGGDAAGEDEAGAAGAQHVGLGVAVAGLGAGVRLEVHAEGELVELRGLGRVADHEADVVLRGDRERVAARVVLDQADELLELVEGEVGLELVGGERAAGGRGLVRRRHGAHLAGRRQPAQQYGESLRNLFTRGAVMDDLDRRLLALFADDPRIGVLQASRELGVARGTVQARLDKLAVAGRGHRLGAGALAGGARLPGDGVPDPGDPAGNAEHGGHDAVARHLATIPEVLEAHTITGAGDLLARVVARSNSDLQRVIDLVLQDPAIVRSSTVIALATQIPYRVLPLAHSRIVRDVCLHVPIGREDHAGGGGVGDQAAAGRRRAGPGRAPYDVPAGGPSPRSAAGRSRR